MSPGIWRIGESTLWNWVTKDEQNGTVEKPPLNVNERAELEPLRVAEMEGDFLMKAAAFFASQNP